MELNELFYAAAIIAVTAVLFGYARVVGLTALTATSVLVLAFHKFGGNDLPSFNQAVVFAGIYILAGFLTTVVWHLSFLFSVRSKYRQFLSSPEFAERLGIIRKSYLLGMDEGESRKLKDFLPPQEEPPYTRTSYLNAQVDFIRCSDYMARFYDFGPTTDLTDLYVYLGTQPHYFKGIAVYHPEDCEKFLNSILPPKVSRVGKVLALVWVFWPSALLWLTCRHLVKSLYNFVVGLGRRLYDGLGMLVFRKI